MKIGIDLGGSKIEGIVMAGQGEILVRQRVPTPKGDYSKTLSAIAQICSELHDRARTLPGQMAGDGQSLEAVPAGTVAVDTAAQANMPVGIGTPGAQSYKTGLMKNCNSTCLLNKPLLEDLCDLLQVPVRMANDADCFALSEAIDGAGKDANVVFGVIIGTGTGGGLVVNRKLVCGPNGISGEWGHNPMPIYIGAMADLEPILVKRPRSCYCGKQDCIETYLSGPALQQDYYFLTGEEVSVEDVVEKAQQGEQISIRVLEAYYECLAMALSTLINTIDPECIVLGGGVSNIAGLSERVMELLPKYVFSDDLRTSVVLAKYGDSSGVRGAAWLW